MTRQSLEHSFHSRESLWAETKGTFRMVAICANETPGKAMPETPCRDFLGANERAREQWKLELAFYEFERKF